MKPSEDVMNLFDKKTYGLPKGNPLSTDNKSFQQHKRLFEFEGRYDDEKYDKY